MAKKYFIKTFGCQMNVYDSNRMANILETMGFVKASNQRDADVVVFNTCHIREKAAEKVFSDLGREYQIKLERAEEGKDTIIGVTGCVVQAEDKEILKRAPYVDFALGPLRYFRLKEVVNEILQKREMQLLDTEFSAVSKFDYLPENKTIGGCSFLAIQEGCNNFCTYCVVPYTRGVEVSRPVEDVLREARCLADSGTLEINLLGQNVNSYHGEDANGKERNLAYLLNKVAEIDGIKRIRYTTSYPADVDDDLIMCHKNIDKLMPYLHLPIQSGSDDILKKMNRRHTKSDYLKVVEKLKKANPNIGMSSDFIVGFPGESDADFQQTLDVVNQVKYIQAFSFKYSRRPGTPAAVMENQIEEKVKKERLQILQDLLFDYQTKFNESSVGKVMPVLFEGKGRHKGQLTGRTPYMQNLYAEADFSLINKIVEVRVASASTNSLSGEVI
ncbi:MAG: tRNA (N6-isopentenyl adenosine(37)-C2)-methylthiotransferase MiaB [Alphaproteobacteria bacterium]|nr:tRNA (N6-isopentenyl adenosine(37)-C2)-methylthiotransferase MiaB [Alphaproteobacteria bacterium]